MHVISKRITELNEQLMIEWLKSSLNWELKIFIWLTYFGIKSYQGGIVMVNVNKIVV